MSPRRCASRPRSSSGRRGTRSRRCRTTTSFSASNPPRRRPPSARPMPCTRGRSIPTASPTPTSARRPSGIFQDLTTAFNTLMNDASRQEYDAVPRSDRSPPRPRRSPATPSSAPARCSRAGQIAEAVTLYRTAVHHAPGRRRATRSASARRWRGTRRRPARRSRCSTGPPSCRPEGSRSPRGARHRAAPPGPAAAGAARSRSGDAPSPPATRGWRPPAPRWGAATRERDEDLERGAHRRRAQAQGQRGRPRASTPSRSSTWWPTAWGDTPPARSPRGSRWTRSSSS